MPLDLTAARGVLQETWGYDDFRGQQSAVIDRTLHGEHSLVLMPTGGGKSLCYQVPALIFDGLTVVLSPLIALMKDQVDALTQHGIDATYINSSLKKRERLQRYAGIQDGAYKLVYVTPERFQKDDFKAAIAGRKISLLAIDEAHCVSEWGHDFRPDYTRVDEIRRFLGEPTTLALTATATPDVQEDIVRQLDLSSQSVKLFHQGIDRPNLSLAVEEVWGDDEKIRHIIQILHEHGQGEAGMGSNIVYFTLIKTLERFSQALRKLNMPHLCYHGDLPAGPRKGVQEAFMTGEVPVVLATNAFGMGIDKPDIRTVTHAEVPGSMEAYYQEIGRAGRDGLPSRCTLLYDQNDLPMLMEFIRWSNPDAEFYQRVYHHLDHDIEQINAFGFDWLKEKLHARQGRHDRRLDSAFLMLQRWGVLEGDVREGEQGLKLVGDLPKRLLDEEALAEKLVRDQKKLYAMVQYANFETDRKAFLDDYFMGKD